MWNQAEEALYQSVTRLVTGVAGLLPGVVALVVAVSLAAVLAWLFGVILRRTLRGLDFDGKTDRWGWSGVGDLSPGKSPTQLVVRLSRAAIILLGALVGVAALDTSVTTEVVMPVLGYVPDVLTAGLVAAVGIAAARFLGRGVLIGAVNMGLPLAQLLGAGVRWLVLVLAAAMVLKHLGVGGTLVDLAFGILFGGIVLALALSVGLGSRDLVSRTLEQHGKKSTTDSGGTLHHL